MPLEKCLNGTPEITPYSRAFPLTGVVAHDELYINLAFDGEPLLMAPGEDGKEHVTAWMKTRKDTRVFGTTLGHSTETIQDPVFQQLLVNGLLWITGSLSSDDTKTASAPSAYPPIRNVSNAGGAGFLSQDARKCMQWEIGKAIGPCYLGCTLNPAAVGRRGFKLQTTMQRGHSVVRDTDRSV